MKEMLRQTLTNYSQTPYSKGGDIFMEGKPDMPPNSQPTSPEHSAKNGPQVSKLGVEKSVSAERQAATREAWDKFDKGRILSVDERRVREEIIKIGLPPISGGAQQPGEQTPEAGRAGIPPGGGEPPPAPPINPPEDQGGSPQEPKEGSRKEEEPSIPEGYIDVKLIRNEGLKSIAEKINNKLKEVGLLDKLEDQFLAEQMAAIRRLIDEKKIAGADQLIAENLMSQLSQLRMGRLGSLERALQDRDPELRAVALEIIKVFSNDKVRKELIKNNPNLDDLGELKNLIDKVIDPTRQDILVLANTITDENGISIQGKEKLMLPDESKKLLYEWLVEKIISIPDKTPDAHYNIGSFYITANLDSLLDTARRRLDVESSTYLNELRHYRQVMHELNVSLRFAEDYKQFVLKELSSNGFDFVNNRLAGVGGIIRLYEKAYANKVRERRKWLTGQDVNEVDNEVEQVVNSQLKNEEITKEGRVLTEWEKDRALRLGRILFSGSQRKAIYSGFGNLPAGVASRIGSVPDEYIVRSIYDWKIFAPRFYGPEPAPRRFIQHVFEHVRSLNPKAFDNDILGVKADTLIENSFGGYDMQSHEWRSELLFLGNQLFVSEDGEKRTLDQILNAKIDEYTKGKIDEHTKEEIDEGIWGYPKLDDDKKKSKDKPTEKEKFSNDVRNVVLGQRAYLSSLVRYGNFSGDLKADIWRKRASLMPSTAVTLLPDEMLKDKKEIEMWDGIRDKEGKKVTEGIRHKLYRAEERRIQSESLNKKTERELVDEAMRFRRGIQIPFTPDELKELKEKLKEVGFSDKDTGPILENMANIRLGTADSVGEMKNLVDSYSKRDESHQTLSNEEKERFRQELSQRGKPLTKEELTNNKEFRYEFVNRFCNTDEFSPKEKEFIKQLIDRVYDGVFKLDEKGEAVKDKNGKKVIENLADRLAKANMSFTLMIDDTPSIAWKKKGGEYGNAGFETADFIRLLASDQDNFTKGWGPMVGLTESPQSANFEVFEKAVEPIGQVVGRDSAQKKIEPFISATAKMYSTDTTAEFTPGLMLAKRIFDRPTSEIERYFKKTYISWNAEKRKNFFVKLLQARALGNEGFERMRKETRSTQEWVLLTLFKFWIELIGVEAAYQMLKAFLPEEVSKSL